MTRKKAPESYLNVRRPPLGEAVALERGSMQEAVASLTKKGYFAPPSRPWKTGVHDKGMGRYSFAVLDCFGDIVVETRDQATAELIVSAVNAQEKNIQT